MLWLIAAISAYLILSIVFTIDKYLLGGGLPNPKIYAFYVGILGILVLFLIPFVDFSIPEFSQIILAFLSGAIYVYDLFWFYKALSTYEASRIVPAIGALVPLFTFGLVFVFSFGKETLSFTGFIALLLLISGSVLITLEKKKFINLKSLRISAITAFLFSLSFILAKYVYLEQSFWSAFIWLKIGGILMALSFLSSKEVKKGVFRTKTFQGKIATLFLFNQGMGALANILQNWAIALAPLVYVSIINALQGVQYAFLFLITLFLSFKFPQILKERITKGILIQKIVAIFLIGLGLAILAF